MEMTLEMTSHLAGFPRNPWRKFTVETSFSAFRLEPPRDRRRPLQPISASKGLAGALGQDAVAAVPAGEQPRPCAPGQGGIRRHRRRRVHGRGSRPLEGALPRRLPRTGSQVANSLLVTRQPRRDTCAVESRPIAPWVSGELLARSWTVAVPRGAPPVAKQSKLRARDVARARASSVARAFTVARAGGQGSGHPRNGATGEGRQREAVVALACRARKLN